MQFVCAKKGQFKAPKKVLNVSEPGRESSLKSLDDRPRDHAASWRDSSKAVFTATNSLGSVFWDEVANEEGCDKIHTPLFFGRNRY